MENDKRYYVVKILIERDHIRTLNDIYNYVPKSHIAKHLHMNTDRITQLIEKPEKISIDKLMKIGALLDVDLKRMLELTYRQVTNNKKKSKKNPPKL